MAKHERSSTTNSIQHRSMVLSAVNTYLTSNFITLEVLAHTYNVCGNDIHLWFCQAVARRYIAQDDVCINLMQKHVREYEKKHHIRNSSLRSMYQRSFEAREKGPTCINVNTLLDRNRTKS